METVSNTVETTHHHLCLVKALIFIFHFFPPRLEGLISVSLSNSMIAKQLFFYSQHIREKEGTSLFHEFKQSISQKRPIVLVTACYLLRFKDIYFSFMCVSVFPACMHVHLMYAWGFWRPDESVGPPGPAVTDVCAELDMTAGFSARSARALNL